MKRLHNIYKQILAIYYTCGSIVKNWLISKEQKLVCHKYGPLVPSLILL
ncbi:hypothetical protein HNQ88_004585, partial [Aureibacter tunicatorum]|nr:hypothetical protein [Aureibacter tunicatorum]